MCHRDQPERVSKNSIANAAELKYFKNFKVLVWLWDEKLINDSGLGSLAGVRSGGQAQGVPQFKFRQRVQMGLCSGAMSLGFRYKALTY